MSIRSVSHMVLYVNDQDEALKFYVDKLGFKVHTDVDFSGMRWLTLNAPNQNDLEFVLFPATKAESKAIVGKQAPEGPLFCIASDDCKADYERLKGLGVNFVQEPKEQQWGTEALFTDLYGNIIDMVQPVE